MPAAKKKSTSQVADLTFVRRKKELLDELSTSIDLVAARTKDASDIGVAFVVFATDEDAKGERLHEASRLLAGPATRTRSQSWLRWMTGEIRKSFDAHVKEWMK